MCLSSKCEEWRGAQVPHLGGLETYLGRRGFFTIVKEYRSWYADFPLQVLLICTYFALDSLVKISFN